jgi:hypothetical protein
LINTFVQKFPKGGDLHCHTTGSIQPIDCFKFAVDDDLQCVSEGKNLTFFKSKEEDKYLDRGDIQIERIGLISSKTEETPSDSRKETLVLESIGLKSSSMDLKEAINFIKATHEDLKNEVEVVEEKQEKLDEIQIKRLQESKQELERARDIVNKMPSDPDDLQLKVNFAIAHVQNKLTDVILDDLKPIAIVCNPGSLSWKILIKLKSLSLVFKTKTTSTSPLGFPRHACPRTKIILWTFLQALVNYLNH